MIQHPELDGPFDVPTAWTTQTVNGQSFQVATAFVNNRWNTTQTFFVAHAPALARYRVSPNPMTRIWLGDDPASPAHTVALAFPDAVTAETVLTACGATTPPIP